MQPKIRPMRVRSHVKTELVSRFFWNQLGISSTSAFGSAGGRHNKFVGTIDYPECGAGLSTTNVASRPRVGPQR
jgi:hypothetical protein